MDQTVSMHHFQGESGLEGRPSVAARGAAKARDNLSLP